MIDSKVRNMNPLLGKSISINEKKNNHERKNNHFVTQKDKSTKYADKS